MVRCFVAIFCADFVGSDVAWVAVTFACLVVSSFVCSMFVRSVLFFAAAVWLYYIGVRSCLNCVEFGAIARCIVVSIVLRCSLSLSLSL